MDASASGITPATLSTMTVTARLDTNSVDLLSVAIESEMFSGELRPGPTRRQFDNQLSFKVDNKSVKIFKNGSIHVTGCRSITDFCQATAAVQDAVARATGVLHDVVDVKIRMINSSFGIGHTVHLGHLLTKALDRGWLATWNPDMYCGLNAKIPTGPSGPSGPSRPRHVTALVFASGKMILAGASAPEDLKDAYWHLVNLVTECSKDDVFRRSQVNGG